MWFVFSWGRRTGELLSHFSSGFTIRGGPAPRQMGPVRETHRGVLSLGETSELWALARDQLFIKRIRGVAQQSALRWYKG